MSFTAFANFLIVSTDYPRYLLLSILSNMVSFFFNHSTPKHKLCNEISLNDIIDWGWAGFDVPGPQVQNRWIFLYNSFPTELWNNIDDKQ